MQRILIISLIFIGIIGCRRVDNGSEKGDQRNAFLKKTDPEPRKSGEMYYRFPAPNDIVDYIAREELEYYSTLPNDVKKSDTYVTSKDISLNLGIYIADLVYITLFENLKQASQYFDAVEKLAGKVSLSSVFGEEIKNRVHNNLDNVDSLNNIARDSYNKMVRQMIQTGNEEKLAIISAGAYIETVYLIVNQLNSFEDNNEQINKIFEQKFAFENLLNYMEEYTDNEEIKGIYDKLKLIRNELDKAVNRNPELKTQVSSNKGGALVFSGGGYKIDVKESHYQSLKEVVSKIRQQIVSL